MIAEYLENAIRFEQMAEQSSDPKFKANLLQQAAAYRKLAAERAKKLNITLPTAPATRRQT
jgi:hypothetical protein